ncbi:MAG: WbuC family cupin fold metalloprotein [Xanthobacteraceae bacterium]
MGGDSELGAATRDYLRSRNQPVLVTTRRRNLASPERFYFDILDFPDDWAPPAGVDAACIFVSVARLLDCANDPMASARVNIEQTLRLIDRLTASGIYVLFLSSNQVFDGQSVAVAPTASPRPVSEYGRQKAATERAIFERMAKGAPLGILRLSKVISPNFPLIQDWIDTLAHGKPIQAFNDMTLAPVPDSLVSAAIEGLLKSKSTGVFQLSGPRDVTYFDIGCYIAKELGADPKLVRSIRANDGGMPEGATPNHTTLDSSALRTRFGIEPPDPWTLIGDIVKPRTAKAKADAIAKVITIDDLVEVTEGVYYSKYPVPLANADLIMFLKKIAATSTLRRARFCAHAMPGEEQHDMLIATHAASYVAPHRHMSKAEAFTLLEGECEMILFDEKGVVEDVVKMGPAASGMPFFYRMPAKQFHSLRSLTETLVFLENTKGPFNLDDREYAAWAPDYRDGEAGTAYIQSALEAWSKSR